MTLKDWVRTWLRRLGRGPDCAHHCDHWWCVLDEQVFHHKYGFVCRRHDERVIRDIRHLMNTWYPPPKRPGEGI